MPGHEDGRAAKRSRSDTVVVVVSGAHLAGFALAAFVLIVIPGPSVLFLIGRALTLGRGPAMAGVVGNALGVYLVAILVAVGLGSIVQRSDLAYNVVKTVGGVYLVWLGIQAIRHRHDLVAAVAGATTTGRSRWSAARRGLLVGISKPKALIIFGAVLPQFVDRSGGHVPEQMLLLALVAFGIALISDSLWVLAASGVHAWLSSSPRRIAAVGGAGGLAMIGVGIGVATTGRRGS
jgi:threonine/homoserine/homoserine lactone efflux protein